MEKTGWATYYGGSRPIQNWSRTSPECPLCMLLHQCLCVRERETGERDTERDGREKGRERENYFLILENINNSKMEGSCCAYMNIYVNIMAVSTLTV